MNSAHRPSEGGKDVARALHLVKSCPACEHAYQRKHIRIIDEEDHSQLIHATCGACAHAMLALIVHERGGAGSVGMMTDLSAQDVFKLKGKAPVSEDDVLSLHEMLKSRSVHFVKHCITQIESV